jgi:sugar O-acyltransferase (sialic acid O-acetyltransferase NeuD family)
MKRLVIFGARGFAQLAHFYFTHDSDHEVVAFTVDGAYLRESTVCGLPVVPFEELERRFPPSEVSMFVAVGNQSVNAARAAKVAEAEARGYRLESFLSSRAFVSPDLVVPPNSMVMELAGIQPFVTIGRDTIVWSTTRIGFGTTVGDHCWLVSSVFGESVTVGDGTFVGLNATIAPGVTLGRSNVIGAGAIITRDTGDFEVYRARASEPSKASSRRLWRTRS